MIRLRRQTRTAVALLTAACLMHGLQSAAHAQATDKKPIPELKAQDPEQAKFLKMWNERVRGKELERLHAEAELRQGHLDALIRKRKQLAEDIESQKDLLELLNRGLIGVQAPYWEKHDPLWKHWPFPRARFPLILHDVIEKWIPEFERAMEARMKELGIKEMKYSLYQVWQWAIPREEAQLREMQHELEGMPDRIKDAEKNLTDTLENLNIQTTSLPGMTGTPGSESAPSPDDVIDTKGTGELFGKGFKLEHLTGCGNGDPDLSMKFPLDRMKRGLGQQIFDFMGLDMPCPGLTGGKIVDFQKACNTFSGARPPMTARVLPWGLPTCWPNNRKWRPPKLGEAGWGINSVPLTGVCYQAYFGRPAKREDMAEMVPLLKFKLRALQVECFYVKRAALKQVLQAAR